MGDTQYFVTGAFLIVAIAVMVLRREHVWHRSPLRFWALPIVAVVAGLAAIPAGEIDSAGGAVVLVFGAGLGLALGTGRSSERFTEVTADPDGSIAYRPNTLGLVVLLVVLVAHYAANLLADEARGLQFVLTVLVAYGVGETVGWHVGVFRRWRALRATEEGPSPAA